MSEDRAELTRWLAEVAGMIAPEWIETLATRLERLDPGGSPTAWGAAARGLPPGARDLYGRLVAVWAAQAEPTAPAAIAWALRSASSRERMSREERAVDLVWTGPVPSPGTLRQTGEAVLEVVRAATRSLLIVTYVAFGIPDVAAALAQARRRGVRIELVLDTPADSPEKPKNWVLRAFGERIEELADVYVWPQDERGRGACGSPVMHAKCIVADSSLALVSSANFTGTAQSSNIELGVLIRGGELPGQIVEQFDGLIRAGVLRRLDSGTPAT